jgi:dethiobiotin synthetase
LIAVGAVVVMSGTGTGIGKTHLGETVLRALGRLVPRVAGVKPVESGVEDGVPTDARRLADASTFHVKQETIALREPVSPHRAARLEGIAIDVPSIARGLRSAADAVDVLLVELPGGLFTPLSDDHLNADLVASLQPTALLLAAPDRLGVLHDVLSTLLAAQTMDLAITGVVLVTPAQVDASTGTNAEELARLSSIRILPTVPRAPVTALAHHPAIGTLARLILRSSDPAPAR